MIKKDVYEELIREKARRDFFTFCKLTAPSFYKEERKYLKELCFEMQAFTESADDILVINMPPRHGKSRTEGKLVEFILGRDRTKKIITGSYNETLSTSFSKTVRNDIQEVKAQKDITVYSDIFPKTRIKYGDGANNLWSLEGGYASYLATSPTGTSTGFGADYIIIDDLIKTAEEASNELILEKQWLWFTNTLLSRLESDGKIIIVMTRWNTKDIAGRVMRELPERGYKVKSIIKKAQNDKGQMLCPNILTAKEYRKKTAAMSIEIARANYQQEPIDVKGRLYHEFATYQTAPEFRRVCAYVDTADTGKDFLSAYIYGEGQDGNAYILDTLYTQRPMEYTEPALASLLVAHGVNVAHIESNNGGRGFARNVQRLIDRQGARTVVDWFTQTKNKNARIYSNATWAQEHIIFPSAWRTKWPTLHKDLMAYQRIGRNAHDDAPDALTGIVEKFGYQPTRKAQVKIFKEGI